MHNATDHTGDGDDAVKYVLITKELRVHVCRQWCCHFGVCWRSWGLCLSVLFNPPDGPFPGSRYGFLQVGPLSLIVGRFNRVDELQQIIKEHQ